MSAVWAVVLAGGRSQRFGADKLAAAVDGVPLLDRALAGVPADLSVVVVGPARDTARLVTFVVEDPPGGGPAAGLVAGLAAALAAGATEVVVLPGDAPDAGHAAQPLLSALRAQARPWAVVATDATGSGQPLQLALTAPAAAAVVAAAGPTGGAGESARRLLGRLEPSAQPVVVPDRLLRDIDTRDQLAAWLDTPQNRPR